MQNHYVTESNQTAMLIRSTSIVAETLKISAVGRVYNFLVSMTGVGSCTVRSANTRAFFANLHFYIFLKLYCCTEMNIFVVFLLVSCVFCEISYEHRGCPEFVRLAYKSLLMMLLGTQ